MIFFYIISLSYSNILQVRHTQFYFNFSHKVEGIINSIPPGHLSQSKMVAIKDLVESQIFRLPQCRAILLPVFCKQIVERLEGNAEVSES